ncbi:D-ribose pyranase [Enterovibrio sp. ZSDZ35]|uniref:D-ribose pyranase n=1 Tax=Enterovibrio qingdaonensis TaxID=2899818 RepID=A0ABT5QGD2_9GAMM|nr:D-ribose pyranase [Enterovibrio sp. ZSDZ35]MDD1780043.1 D-ribose pyranase [Enterovibrio sp. ZSDZ35]
MKKNTLLNSEIAHLISTLGHTDEYVICDAGLPIPQHVQRIDLALTHGVPGFIETVRVVLSESQIEGVVLAEEFAAVSPDCHEALIKEILDEEERSGKSISIQYVSHEDFKVRTHDSHAVIRTGECTPYANVIFKAGVVF